jgi:uncharacterized protein (TIGR02646 family)
VKHITKEREPPSLTQHRLKAHATYGNYEEKDDLRETLLREQGGICCYCMRRIDYQNMKIEHWACQDKHSDRQLDYRNLLGACDGGEGTPKRLQHCDTHKGDDDIRVHPADSTHNCEDYVRYQADGTIYSDNNRINSDLDGVLNLNLQTLCNNRKEALAGALAGLTGKRPIGAWTRSFLEAEVRRCSNRSDSGRFREYCQVVSYHLQKRIARTRN